MLFSNKSCMCVYVYVSLRTHACEPAAIFACIFSAFQTCPLLSQSKIVQTKSQSPEIILANRD